MSDQGPLSHRNEEFGLIETLLWTREDGYAYLPEHLARLSASSAALGFAHDGGKVTAALAAIVARTDAPRLRVRLVLSRTGAIETSAAPIDPVSPETSWRVARAERRFDSTDALLRHKTTRRALYEDELAKAAQKYGADEVLFINERDELCESARCNLFVPADGALLTPPLSCGVLAGTLRAALLADGRAMDRILHLDDLPGAFYLGNSVRGLVRATLIS